MSASQHFSKGTRTCPDAIQRESRSHNCSPTWTLCAMVQMPTTSSTWHCHPPSTTASPPTFASTAWATSQWHHTLTVPAATPWVIPKKIWWTCFWRWFNRILKRTLCWGCINDMLILSLSLSPPIFHSLSLLTSLLFAVPLSVSISLSLSL